MYICQFFIAGEERFHKASACNPEVCQETSRSSPGLTKAIAMENHHTDCWHPHLLHFKFQTPNGLKMRLWVASDMDLRVSTPTPLLNDQQRFIHNTLAGPNEKRLQITDASTYFEGNIEKIICVMCSLGASFMRHLQLHSDTEGMGLVLAMVPSLESSCASGAQMIKYVNGCSVATCSRWISTNFSVLTLRLSGLEKKRYLCPKLKMPT
jgi:hypothetical protein